MSNITPQAGLSSGGSEWAAKNFQILQAISRIGTAALVQIKAVRPGSVGPTGNCDVQIMTAMQDGAGLPTLHGKQFNLPYFRFQGGSNAVILDPVVGDIGVAIFCSRDISKVKKTRQMSNPGSNRTYSLADGLYLGGYLNGTPTQYIIMDAEGIQIVSPTKITLQAPDILIDAENPVVITPDAIIGGKRYLPHEHDKVQNGDGVTGPVV